MTHQVAVNGYIIKDNTFLLLQRKNPPSIWGPPGGRLLRNEDPEQGLKREIHEETALEVVVVQPVTTWFGKFQGEYLLSIDYLCINPAGNIALSEEHMAYHWIGLDQIKAYLTAKEGFQHADFYRAMQIYRWYKLQI
jgi:8-oxo-dGTP diphosphatase